MSDHHHVSLEDLPPDGEKFDVTRIAGPLKVLFAVGVVGVVASVGMLVFGVKAMAYSWLFAIAFFYTITMGGLFWVLLHNASNSGWGVAVRRVMEHLANMVPVMFVLSLPFLLPNVQNALWEWMAEHRAVEHAIHAVQEGNVTEEIAAHHHGVVEAAKANPGLTLQEGLEADHKALLAKKYGYVNMTFWLIRFFAFFFFLWFGAYMLRKFSVSQDHGAGIKATFSARRFACGWLPLFAVSLTFTWLDWLMGLNYKWFSTMWGVYLFAGSAWSSMAVLILTVTWLRSQGYLQRVVTDEHFHLMGKLLFAFTVFWAYIAFSQFFLIWYANITEETEFFILRNSGGWNLVSILGLLFGHFAIPFLALLHVWVKKSPRYITAVCVWILAMHMIDLYWIVIPERGPSLTGGRCSPSRDIPLRHLGLRLGRRYFPLVVSAQPEPLQPLSVPRSPLDRIDQPAQLINLAEST
ncbi:MAG: hypothetical protein R3F11_05135 [Verrucomicrobiales bacterium]